MKRKLNCVVIDDNDMWLDILGTYCKSCKFIESAIYFDEPKKFLDVARQIEYDLLITDISMPGMDGIALAKTQKDKPVIFVTVEESLLTVALEVAPVDVLVKSTITQERFDEAIKKAYLINVGEIAAGGSRKKEYDLFHVAESRRKVKIHLSDIVYAKTDEIDYRNKVIYLNDGHKYTAMNYSFERLLELSSQLIHVNKSEAVSFDIIDDISQDTITLIRLAKIEVPEQVSLGRRYRKKVLERVEYA